jgi:site-specific recombinase XerC
MSQQKIKPVTEAEWSDVNKYNRDITEEFLQQAHLSDQTLTQYKSALRIFFNWVRLNSDNEPLHELRPRVALKYQNYLMKLGLSSSGVKFKRSAVSSICGYLELYYSDKHPLFRNIYSKQIPNPAKAAKHIKHPLTKEELNNLIEVLTTNEEWQELAYLLFSYASGARRAEVAQINKDVINKKKAFDKKNDKELDYYVISNIRGKGRGKTGKPISIIFDEVAKLAGIKWLEVRGEDDCEAMFVRKFRDGRVERLSPSAFNGWCTNKFSEIIGRRMHPHLIRSSRATIASQEDNVDIKHIQKLLNHNDPSTTNIYIVKEEDDSFEGLF